MTKDKRESLYSVTILILIDGFLQSGLNESLYEQLRESQSLF